MKVIKLEVMDSEEVFLFSTKLDAHASVRLSYSNMKGIVTFTEMGAFYEGDLVCTIKEVEVLDWPAHL